MRLRPFLALGPAALLLAACQPPATTVSVDPVTDTTTITAEPGAPAVTVVPDPAAPVAVTPTTPVAVQPL